jgi:hypothetical protein
MINLSSIKAPLDLEPIRTKEPLHTRPEHFLAKLGSGRLKKPGYFGLRKSCS